MAALKLRTRDYVWRGAVIALALYVVLLLISAGPFVRLLLPPWRLLWGERTFIILFQNNYELRPTGGFISSFGTLKTNFGIPKSFQIEDVYWGVDVHEYVAPPAPVGKLLADPQYKGHTFRDANFDPHFPDSARDLTAFLHKTRPELQVDGMIALDLSLLEGWLRALDGVTVADSEINGDNLFISIEEMVTDFDLHDLDALVDRKSGVKEIGVAMAKKSLLPWEIPSVLQALQRGLQEKHLLLNFKNESLQRLVSRRNWGGEMMRTPEHDFLGIVDANYGGAKSNRYVTRTFFYTVDLEKGRARLEIDVAQPNGFNVPLSTNYRAYIRAYVPDEYWVHAAEYTDVDNGLRFAGQTYGVAVESKEKISFDFSFDPFNIAATEYAIDLWKQPGTEADAYNIIVKAPIGTTVTSKDFEVRENIAAFSGALQNDMTLALQIAPDTLPPRPVAQKIAALNRVEIVFNEPIEPGSLHPEEWRFTDNNETHAIRDNLSIARAWASGVRTLTIETIGMTDQEGELYSLEMSPVADQAGNATERRTFSLYQRLLQVP